MVGGILIADDKNGMKNGSKNRIPELFNFFILFHPWGVEMRFWSSVLLNLKQCSKEDAQKMYVNSAVSYNSLFKGLLEFSGMKQQKKTVMILLTSCHATYGIERIMKRKWCKHILFINVPIIGILWPDCCKETSWCSRKSALKPYGASIWRTQRYDPHTWNHKRKPQLAPISWATFKLVVCFTS